MIVAKNEDIDFTLVNKMNVNKSFDFSYLIASEASYNHRSYVCMYIRHQILWTEFLLNS